jgi:DNA-binding NarL/FixJ family response regulator
MDGPHSPGGYSSWRNNKKMKTLIVDADSLMRDGLSALLALRDDIEVIGAVDAVAGLTQVPPTTLPELVILEIGIPDYEGSKTLASLRERWPQARVMVLTFRRDDLSVRAALRAGVDAYMLKSDTRAELLKALVSLQEGTRYVSPAVAERSLQESQVARAAQLDSLSDRERLVMMRIAQGRRTREIATELSLSPKTIEKYRSNLMRKLGLKTAAAVAAYAIAHGFLEL